MGINAGDESNAQSDMALAPQMLLFAQVATCMSFTAAAIQLNCSKSAVSKSVAALEARLGVKMLVRSSRVLRLTEAGKAFLEHCECVRASIRDAHDGATACQSLPVGKLRVSAPVTFGTRYVQPVVSELLRRHPRMQAELQLSDRWVDVRREPVDVAISISQHLPGDVVAREIAQVRWVLCAAPSYLDANGMPESPHMLRSHQMLFVSSEGLSSVQMSKGNETFDLALPSRLRSNNSAAVVQSAETGLGIALLPAYAAVRSLRSAQLVAVLPAWHIRESSVYAQYLAGRHMVPKVRALLDALLEMAPDPCP